VSDTVTEMDDNATRVSRPRLSFACSTSSAIS